MTTDSSYSLCPSFFPLFILLAPITASAVHIFLLFSCHEFHIECHKDACSSWSSKFLSFSPVTTVGNDSSVKRSPCCLQLKREAATSLLLLNTDSLLPLVSLIVTAARSDLHVMQECAAIIFHLFPAQFWWIKPCKG